MRNADGSITPTNQYEIKFIEQYTLVEPEGDSEYTAIRVTDYFCENKGEAQEYAEKNVLPGEYFEIQKCA